MAASTPPATQTANAGAATEGPESKIKRDVLNGDPANFYTESSQGHPATVDAQSLIQLIKDQSSEPNASDHGIDIEYVRITGKFDLSKAHIPMELDFINCEFNGDVDLGFATFEKQVVLAGSDFKGKFKCPAAQFKGDFKIGKPGLETPGQLTRFEGPFYADRMHVSGYMVANFVKFDPVPKSMVKSDDDPILSMNSVRVDGHLNLAHAMIERPADLRSCEIGGHLFCDYAVFAANPAGPLALDAPTPTGNTLYGADFNSIRVTKSLSLYCAVFPGDVDFRSARIGGNFNASGAQFRQMARLGEMTIDGSLYLATAREQDQDGKARDVPLYFGGVLDLTSTVYERLYCGLAESQSYDFQKMLGIAETAVFSADVYSQMEDFLRRTGHPDDADWLHVKCGWRQLIGLPQLPLVPYLTNLTELVLAGYGRYPRISFLWCSIAVAVGTLVFGQGKMILRDPNRDGRYSRFWYSFDLFIPVIKLDIEEIWKPDPRYRCTWLYAKWHKILGWILVPILVAALTGFLH
jgi:hypothetical protein